MEQPGHVIPKSTLFATYIGLVFLTTLMVLLSRMNLEKFQIDWIDLHNVRAWTIMGLATLMGILTAMYLMGLRYEHKLLNLTIFLSNFAFLLIFVIFTWVDTSFRGELDPSFNEKIEWTSPVKANAEHGSKAAH